VFESKSDVIQLIGRHLNALLVKKNSIMLNFVFHAKNARLLCLLYEKTGRLNFFCYFFTPLFISG